MDRLHDLLVLVGGLGTFEEPIIGAGIVYLIQAQFGNSGAWYFVGLGATAIAFALFLPDGIWGAIDRRLRLRLLPVGYMLRTLEAPAAVGPGQEADGSEHAPGGRRMTTQTVSGSAPACLLLHRR